MLPSPLKSLVVAIFLLLTPALAISAPVTWIVDVPFADGGTAQGTFVYDADTATYSNWNVQVTGGNTTTFTPFTYDATSTTSTYANTHYFIIQGPWVGPDSNKYRLLRFSYAAPLTNAGGSVDLIQAGVGSLECYNCFPFRLLIGKLTTDMDGDGYTYDEDCNDSDPYVNPGAHELPGNVIDDNCDGSLGECDPNIVWKNHGQFVRCVAHETDLLIDISVLTQEEGDALIEAAAQSDIGKK